MSKEAEEVLKVIEGLKDEKNRRITFIMDCFFGWEVIVEDQCNNLRTHETFWNEVARKPTSTFIEALDFAVQHE